MAQISRSATIKAPASMVWALIGGFQSLPTWHPAVTDSAKETIDGVEHRRLSLEGGGEILEKHLGGDSASYGYEIIESPLPVDGYRSILTVVDAGDETMVVWSSTFEPTGDGAEDAVAGIYESGLGALQNRFDV